MKKLRNISTNKLVIFLFLVVIFIFVVAKVLYKPQQVYYPSNGETMKDSGQGPSENDKKYIKELTSECPFWSSDFKDKTVDYELVNYSCAFLEDKNKRTGEFVKVRILNGTFGINGFNDLLKNKNILNNPKLNIEFVN
jgi:hypothetical protein